MIDLLLFILFIVGFIEFLCVMNMAPGPFISGYIAYKNSFSYQFDKAHTLRLKKLKERLNSNLDWIHFHEYKLRRLSACEIIFTERKHQFLAKSGPQILYGHLVLNPRDDNFTITGRLSKTYTLALPIISFAVAAKVDGTLESYTAFVCAIISLVIMTKIALIRYYSPRFQEFANAVIDVLKEPHKQFKTAPYSSRGISNRSSSSPKH